MNIEIINNIIPVKFELGQVYVDNETTQYYIYSITSAFQRNLINLSSGTRYVQDDTDELFNTKHNHKFTHVPNAKLVIE